MIQILIQEAVSDLNGRFLGYDYKGFAIEDAKLEAYLKEKEIGKHKVVLGATSI